MKTIGSVVRVILFVSIPAFLVYLSSDYSILDYWKNQKYLGESFNLELFKQYLLIFGIIISSIYLAISNELMESKYSVILYQRSALINQLKIATLYHLESLIQDEHVSSIKFKVWSFKQNIFYKILKKICHILKVQQNTFLYERRIDGLTDIDNSGLFYKVAPDVQGLVGLCYNEKEIKYDEDLSQSLDEYNLSPFQLSRTRAIKFCLCAPIFNTNDEIVSIISFESIHCITIDSNIEYDLSIMITNFCQSLYQNCPELFK